MRIDKKAALKILEEEVDAAISDAGPKTWRKLVQKMEVACGEANLTFFAALATAMLAKATEPSVDVYALKASASERGYSARGLCQHVLAAYAPRLGIDLGVTGREPLNNQPFFAEDSITDRMPVKPRQREALSVLLECLSKLERLKTRRQARNALRAFLSVRKRTDRNWTLNAEAASQLSVREYCDQISAFVQMKSESGKRAQAIAAGILDAALGAARVLCGRIHDPDAKFPGDVVVVAEQGSEQIEQIERSFEVRDKKVNDADIHHFTVKLAECGVSHGAVLCPVNGAMDEALWKALEWAEKRNVIIVVYPNWTDFVYNTFFWSQQSTSELLSRSSEAILQRLQALEVSDAGITDWSNRF
jgi:hypothetical protein